MEVFSEGKLKTVLEKTISGEELKGLIDSPEEDGSK